MGQNPARQAAMKAGIPKEVPSTSINMLCGSGLRAVALGYQAIKCGESRVVVAGGQESMSQVRRYMRSTLKGWRDGEEGGRRGEGEEGGRREEERDQI